jgi:hypothetical protein
MKYKVIYTIEKEVEFDDEEMREYGIEGEITDEKRAKYLECLIADEYDIPCQYNKREVIKID